MPQWYAALMDLNEWLFKNKVSKVDFAKRLKINRQYLHHVMSGRAIPSRALALDIYTATQGRVKMDTHKKIKEWFFTQ